MSNQNNKDEPSINPYETLGVEINVSDAEISKAYKKLALKLHPDKLQQKANLSETERERLAHQFHDVKEARSFLLDPEHKEARQKYDKKLKSDLLRKEDDERRERFMSDR
eukprot:4043012-Ditylum_brightwellii.AAC.1